MSKHNLTLSRWHKVVERANALIKEKTTVVSQSLGNTRVNGFSGSTQVSDLEEKSKKAFAQIEELTALIEAVADIRSVLAVANVEHKVSPLVAKQDAVSRNVAFLKGILSQQSLDMVPPSGIENYKAFETTRGYGAEVGIKVAMLTQSQISDIETQLETYQIELNSLADELADINKAKVEINITSAIEKIAGLSA